MPTPFWEHDTLGLTLYHGDVRAVVADMPDASFDAVVTDPPYPEIGRAYGRLTQGAWRKLMESVVAQVRRVLKPSGSAVFVLQANQSQVGSVRPWLWDFAAWCCRYWNVVQDAYWWNFAAAPTTHCSRRYGLMRPSVKLTLWCGPPTCYRDQASVLWSQSDAMAASTRSCRALRKLPGGQHVRRGRFGEAVDARGGVTPFNLLPAANTDSANSSGAAGHPAGTPLDVCSWWVRYLCPPGGTVLDPFCGAGTVGVACASDGRRFAGIDLSSDYLKLATQRLEECEVPKCKRK
jgi:site-specific DNA-methyltransferase (adenine-specific)